MKKSIAMHGENFKEMLKAVYEKTISKLGIELRESLFCFGVHFLETGLLFRDM